MVFGDKKLKGFAVRGTKYAVPVVDNAKFLAAAKVNKDANIAGEAWEGIKRWGTGGLMETQALPPRLAHHEELPDHLVPRRRQDRRRGGR